MGNWRSSPADGESEDVWWSNNRNANRDLSDKKSVSEDFARSNSADEENSSRELSEEHKEKLNEFKLELARKHEKRRQIIADKRKEMEDLREEVIRLRKENQELRAVSENVATSDRSEESFEVERLRKQNEELKSILNDKSKLLESSEDIIQKNRELRISISEMQKELQHLNSEVLKFEQERHDYKAHVVALKDVIAVSKNMLQIRETQLKELKEKIDSIEESLAGREMNILSHDLRTEYERQLENIRNLRTLYEERQTAERKAKEELASQLDDANNEVQDQQKKIKDLEERIEALEADNSKKYDEIKTLESNLGLSKAESRQYHAELAVINQLFSEILLGFNSSQDIDLDKLQKHLEEHHGLLQNIVSNEISSEVSYALPKVLLDLLNQVNTEGDIAEVEEEPSVDGKLETIKEESESATSTIHQMNSAEEIVENLPKVWRVLIELLSHQKAPVNNLTDDEEDESPCYKTVQTPKGPSLVLSVSQTFIRLKDLILEKKSLEKETNHLKQLNCHLENRLQDQEKRLELVHTELSKTWHVVGKLQKQHQMLHTQEKILRYELAQKRKLLTELKEELEYSREKWAQAREKNSSTEQQWKQLRTEFASRRRTIVNDDLNNSVESGYSDDRECSSDEEPGYETDISECAQQKSSGEDIEELSDVKENPDSTPILNPVQNEFEGASCLVDQNVEVISLDGTKEVIHSDLEQLKTDIVQNDESVENKDVDSTKINETEVSTDTNDLEEPSTSRDERKSTRSLEDLLAQKDRRVKRLEGKAEQLVTRVLDISHKSMAISNKIDILHEVLDQPEKESTSTSTSANDEGREINTLGVTTSTDVLEGGKKTSSGADIDEQSNDNDNEGIADRIPVLEQVQIESESADCQVDQNVESVCLDNCKEAIRVLEPCSNSDLEQPKTEIVRDDGNVEKTDSANGKEMETEVEVNTHTDDLEQPNTSRNDRVSTRSLEEILAQRDERLKRLEGQTEQLVTRVLGTSYKSIAISNKLDNLHEIYGQSTEESNEEPTNVNTNDEEISPPVEESSDDVRLSNSEVPSTDLDLRSMRNNEDNQE